MNGTEYGTKRPYGQVWRPGDRTAARPLATAAITAERNEDPNRAPDMNTATFRKSDELAINEEGCPYKSAFDDAILSVAYARLRFADVRKIRTSGRNGTRTSSKT